MGALGLSVFASEYAILTIRSKDSNSSPREEKIAVFPEATCSMRPANFPLSRPLSVRNCTTNAPRCCIVFIVG
jgi:hypothetical protein